MTLNMFGHIDRVFQSVAATRTSHAGGGYTDGIWSDGSETDSQHIVNVQPLRDKEIQALQIGAERIGDYRKIYVNDGDTYSIAESDTWTLDGIDGVFKTIALDNRTWRNYCRVIVCREDDGE